MGRDIAEASPEAMEVFEIGSEASGLDLQRLCFDTPLEEMVETELQQPALVATSLAFLAALRKRGIEPDFVVGHSVGEFAALAAAGAMDVARDDRARPRARSRDGRGGEGAARVDGRDPRPRGRGRRADLPPDPRRVAGELQLPGPDRRLRRERRGRRVLRAGRGGGRAAGREAAASPARSTRRSWRGPPTGCVRRSRRSRFSEPTAPFMSTVTARLETAQRMGPLLVDQLTAPVRFTQAATELVRDGARTFVEVGPGNVLSGLVKRIDRSVKAIPVNSLAALEKIEGTLSHA